MSTKRIPSLQSSPISSPQKKRKTFDSNNSFYKCLQESGLTLKHPPEKCVAVQETIHIIRNIKKHLLKHFDYPRNVTEFLVNLERECHDIDIFKHYLYPNIVRVTDASQDEYVVTDSVMKILLSVPILQNKLIDYIFEKAIDLAAESNCAPLIQMILKCFSTLDSIVNTEKISTNLINLLDITSEKTVRLEIITALPDIIGDQEHNNIANEISRILSEEHDLIPAILECLSYLCLSDEQYELLQKKTLTILKTLSKCIYFPNFVKFLLRPGKMCESSYFEAALGLRNELGWPSSIASPQDIATSQVLSATAIRNSIISSKVIANAWLKVISSCKVHSDHKPIDLVILLILFSTSEERQKQVENLIKKHIKLDILTEELLNEAFDKYKPIFKDNLRKLIEMCNILLKIKGDPSMESFASHMYTLMISQLEECCTTVVAELLQLSLDSKQCIMNVLEIFNNVAAKDMSLLKPQSLQMLTLLDRMDDMSLEEIRGVMNLLTGLAYSYENSVIRDDIHMIIRKELSSSNPSIKIQGIIAGIHAVKYLMICNTGENETRELPDDVSYSSVTHLSEGDLREAAQIIELICRSTRQFPDMISFFYDELTKIIASSSYINKHFMCWLTDAVTNDLQQNFIVDVIKDDRMCDLKLTMQYCLNAESEMDEIIAINIAELCLKAKSEVCIGILAPLFQLVQTLHFKQHKGNLSSIDALLGCHVIMPKYEIDFVEEMDQITITHILDCLVHCVNWFRELINAFATQDDEALKSKTIRRITQIEELERTIQEILLKTHVKYKPPASYNIYKYKKEQSELNPIKANTSKQKNSKKSIPDDTVIPETGKSQTQNKIVQHKLEVTQNLPFRKMNLNLLYVCKTDLSITNEIESQLTVKSLRFILDCVNRELETVLISKLKKKTFLSKEYMPYDRKKAETYATRVSEVLPKIKEHLETVISYMENELSKGNSQSEHGFMFTSHMMNHILCFESLYNILTTYFKWVGFKNKNNSLLKSSLKTLIGSENVTVSLKDLLLDVAKSVQSHMKYCLQLSTALSLIEFMRTIQNYSDNRAILKLLRNMAQYFLSQQWKTLDGLPEKGIIFNQHVDTLASIYFINNEIMTLKNLTLEMVQEIKLLKGRNDVLNSLKCINKNNFPILYRNLGTALNEATKQSLEKGLTDSEHLLLWKDVAIILKGMSDIAITLENRNQLSTFIKKSLPIIKLFQSDGIPIIEMQFQNKTDEILEILKILQQSTRFLQSLCVQSRLKKDAVLMKKVPFARQLLETLIYKVKAVLTANNCSGAFWMGNLKNKNIHGEVIASQNSLVSQDSIEDDDNQMPEDEDSDDSAEEMLNPDSKSLSDIV